MTTPQTSPNQMYTLASFPKDPGLHRHYAALELRLKARGLLRAQATQAENTLSPAQIRKNFERIALRREYDRTGHVALHRWAAPITLNLHFGGSVGSDTRGALQSSAQRLSKRISNATQHPISMSREASSANISVFVVSEKERKTLGPYLRHVMPSLTRQDLNFVTQLNKVNQCLTIASGSPTITQAVIVIRSELSLFMQRGCLHEELAQAMGLPNDHTQVRPSVFNDDEEFIFLTPHDFQLLKILYHPALRPGMAADQVIQHLPSIIPDPAPEIFTTTAQL